MHIYLIWKLSLKIKQTSTASKTGTCCLWNSFPSDIWNTVLLYLIILLLNLVLLSWNCSAAKWLLSQSQIGHSHSRANFSCNCEPQQPPGPIYLYWVPSSWCRQTAAQDCIFGSFCKNAKLHFWLSMLNIFTTFAQLFFQADFSISVISAQYICRDCSLKNPSI